jgi:xanthine dehydrogenase YagS FAD-binding subunit
VIAFPTTAAEAAALLAARPDAVLRAGGTDVADLRHRGLQRGPTVDLRDTTGLAAVSLTETGGLRIGARVRLDTLAADPLARAGWPGLAQAAGGLATPQVRAVATVAGSLLQDVRCWYYRDPAAACLKKGGSRCLAREGDSLQHACYDLGACIAPHPSTLAMALLALDATVELEGAAPLTMAPLTIAALLGDGSDPKRTHTLRPGAVVTAIVLPAAPVGVRAAYHRTIQRARAEWPLVEAYVHYEVDAGRIVRPRVAIGGVANRPLRLPEVEAALTGLAADADIEPALQAVNARAQTAIPANAWRARLVVPTLLDTFADARAAVPSAGPPRPPAPPVAAPVVAPTPVAPRGAR